jgi:hypothetical protein
MKPDPLQARQDGRQLVAALDGQDDPLDGDDLEGGGWDSKRWRMANI